MTDRTRRDSVTISPDPRPENPVLTPRACRPAREDILVMSPAAHNLVLVGDPMQLPQPLQGAHPGRSGESCLEYLIDNCSSAWTGREWSGRFKTDGSR
jgi:hypothetical protein